MTRPLPAPKYAPLARSRVVVVGDASEPIGRAIALLLAERGYAVLATGHDAAAMSDMPRETAQGGMLDTAPARAPVARALALFGRIDGVVATAPQLTSGPFANQTIEALLAPLSAQLSLVHAAIPQLAGEAHSRGRVVLVGPSLVSGSIGATLVRTALDAITDPLGAELSLQRILVSTITVELARVVRRRVTPVALAELVHKVLAAPRPKPRYVLKIGAAQSDA